MAGCQDTVHKRSYARSLSAYKETPSKQGESLVASVSPSQGLLLECALLPLPGVVNRSGLARITRHLLL